MKKLIDQILKFGVVGIISFIVDFVITMAVSTLLRTSVGMTTSQAALVGAFFCDCELYSFHEICV